MKVLVYMHCTGIRSAILISCTYNEYNPDPHTFMLLTKGCIYTHLNLHNT